MRLYSGQINELKAFRPRLCRYTKERTEPRYVSVVDIEAKQHIDLMDIIDAENDGAIYRLRNVAIAKSIAEKPKKVVIKFEVFHFVYYIMSVNFKTA